MGVDLVRGVSLAPYCTFRCGGEADWFAVVRHVDQLADLAQSAHRDGTPLTVLGWGSNVLPADDGVQGAVVVNACTQVEFSGLELLADCGCGLQALVLACAKRGLGGLEYAVGIPGSLGGALVSNAGAYGSSISDHLLAVEIVESGERRWVDAEYLRFDYRHSILRQPSPPPIVLLRARLRLPQRAPERIYSKAWDIQRQRILKQPTPASAGSFFKNLKDKELADSMETLPARMKEYGVVPAGHLIEAVGLKGHRHGGAMVARGHANFILNVAGATATEVRQLAQLAQARVAERFGIALEEEVLYLGRWSDWPTPAGS